MSRTPPVLFLVFNRPDTTARVFEAIRAARPATLYVAADGPRADRPDEAERCAEVRRIATTVDWPCEVKTLFRDTNLGCRDAPANAINWFFENEPEGIVLEDDCLPDSSFFAYCSELLERYRHDARVSCITGNNFQVTMKGWRHSYYFSIYNHGWGWASWRRAWLSFDVNMAAFSEAEAKTVISAVSKDRLFGAYWLERFRDVAERNLDAWDYQWTWACWRQGGLTCTPSANLVSNIGFGSDATHTLDERDPAARLATHSIETPLLHPERIEARRSFDRYVTRHHFGVRRQNLIRRIILRIRRDIRRALSISSLLER